MVLCPDPRKARFSHQMLRLVGVDNSNRSSGRLDMEIRARSWLQAAETITVVVANANWLDQDDFAEIRRVLPPDVNLIVLVPPEHEERVSNHIGECGFKAKSLSALPRVLGRKRFRGAKLPFRIDSTSGRIASQNTFLALTQAGIEKVERTMELGLRGLPESELTRWITIASSDHSGLPCPFRLWGIVLKMWTSGFLVNPSRRPGAESSDLIVCRTSPWTPRDPSSARTDLEALSESGLTYLEFLAVDLGQVAARGGVAQVSGITYMGRLARELHALKLEAAGTKGTRWLIDTVERLPFTGERARPRAPNWLMLASDQAATTEEHSIFPSGSILREIFVWNRRNIGTARSEVESERLETELQAKFACLDQVLTDRSRSAKVTRESLVDLLRRSEKPPSNWFPLSAFDGYLSRNDAFSAIE